MDKLKFKSLVNLTTNLIKFETVNTRRDEINKSFTFIKNYLKKLPIKEYLNQGYKSLAISNSDFKTKNFDIILHGHIDVVPAENSQDFIPKITKDAIFGRSALDMKGGLSCLIFLMKNYFNTNKISKKVLLLITSDEETGGKYGTEFLLKKIGFRGDFFITAEGEKNYLLKIKQKGVLFLKLKSIGKGGHSAYTWNGINAIKKLMFAYSEIEKLFPAKGKNHDHWYSTINLGKISGGTVANSIPSSAECEIDIRFCEPWKSSSQVFARIKKTVSKIKGVTVEIIYGTEMMNTDKNNKYTRKLNMIARQNLNYKKDLYFNNHGTNDARFASEVGIPAVGFGPTGDNYHSNSEWVSLKSLENYYKILEQFIYLK